MKSFKLPLALLLLLAVASACGPVQDAVAPRNEVKVAPLKEFPLEKVEFTQSQLFLWPDNVNYNQVSRILFLSDEIDRLDAAIKPTRNKVEVLNKDLAKVDSDMNLQNALLLSLNGKIRRDDAEIAKNSAQIEEATKELETARAENPPSDEKVKGLESKIANLQTAIGKAQKDKETAAARIPTVQSNLDQLNQNPKVVERARLLPILARDDNTKTVHLSEISTTVSYWADPAPSTIGFYPTGDGQFVVRIYGWGLNHNETKLWDFSSEALAGKKPTIVNLKYTKLGGIFEFDVLAYEDENQTVLRETYTFKISRYKYDENDGKVYYTGKMNRTRVLPSGKSEVVLGIAKLQDKNN